MPRRIHVSAVVPDQLILLDAAQARHARDVLRLPDGSPVEVFDDAGLTAPAVLVYGDGRGAAAAVRIAAAPQVTSPPTPSLRWSVAAAVPKGERADWMVEKLSELGAAAFIPLAAARSVVLPEGQGKRERWSRIATESAKQSRRPGVMRIGELAPPGQVVRESAAARAAGTAAAWFFSTSAGTVPVAEAVRRVEQMPSAMELTMFIGPEGGWTDTEAHAFESASVQAVGLTRTVLRVETAAVAAAAVVSCLLDRRNLDGR